MVSEIVITNVHTHCEGPNNNSSLRTKQNYEPLAEMLQEKSSVVVPNTAQNISLKETGALTNGDSDLSRNEFYLVPTHELENSQNLRGNLVFFFNKHDFRTKNIEKLVESLKKSKLRS